MSNPNSHVKNRSISSHGAVPLMLYPIPDEARAKYDAEITMLAVDEVEQSGAVQLLEVRQI